MYKWLLAAAFCLLAQCAWAQNTTCATRPPGDSSNACASTAFVTNAASTSANSVAVLQTIAAVQGALYTTKGYYTPGDGGQFSYIGQSAACSLNAGAGDGGSQIAASNGGCFIAQYTTSIPIDSFGARHNGTDDAVFFARANAAAVRLGTFTVTLGPNEYSILSPVHFLGPSNLYGCSCAYGFYHPGDALFFTQRGPYTIIRAPGVTIDFLDDASAYGIRVVQQGYVQGTTLRDAINLSNSFAGTAVSAKGNENTFSFLTIIGALNGIQLGDKVAQSGSRSNLSDLMIDATQGVDNQFCGDACYATRTEVWPIASVPASGIQNQVSTVIAVTNSSGACEVILSSVPATPLVTGDTLVFTNPGTNCSGRFGITVVDPTHLILPGTTFGGALTSNGTAGLTSTIRIDPAFLIEGTGSLWCTDCSEYGHDRSVDTEDTSYGIRFDGFWADGPWQNDPIPIGIAIGGSTNTAHFNGVNLLQKGRAVVNAANTTLLINGGIIGATGVTSGLPGAGVLASAGLTAITGVQFLDNGNTPNNVYYFVQDGAKLTMTGLAPNPTIPNPASPNANFFQNYGGDCPNYVHDGAVGPCPWTPTLQFNGNGTGITYAANGRNGLWSRDSTGRVTALFTCVLSNKGAITGPASIAGLPLASTTAQASAFANDSSFIGSANMASLGAADASFVGANTTLMTLATQGAAGVTALTDANFTNTSTFFGTARYQATP